MRYLNSCWEHNLFPGLCEFGGGFSRHFSPVVLSLDSSVFFLYIYIYPYHSARDLMELLWRSSGVLFLWGSFSLFCHSNSSHLSFIKLPTLCLQLNITELCLGSFFLHCGLAPLSQLIPGAPFICYPSLGNHWPMLPAV